MAAQPCDSTQLGQIVDLVGYGAPPLLRGRGGARRPPNTTADLRGKSGGCVETDNNAADFTGRSAGPAQHVVVAERLQRITLTVNDVAQIEGNSGTTTFTFSVSLSGAAGAGGVMFDIATSDGTAQDDPSEDNDYVAVILTGQTIPEAARVHTRSTSPSTATPRVEPNETFFVDVTGVTGATIPDGQGQGTIQNDDVTLSRSTTSRAQPICRRSSGRA